MTTATAQLLFGGDADLATDREAALENVSDEPFLGRRNEPVSLALAERLETIGKRLVRKAPDPDRLDATRDLFIELCVISPVMIDYRKAFLALGDFMRRPDDTNAAVLGEILINAGLDIEERALPRTQPELTQMCLSLMGLEVEELAELDAVKPETIRRRLKKSGHWSVITQELAEAGYWLSRRGLGPGEARRWFFEDPNKRLEGLTPHARVVETASPWRLQLAKVARAELLEEFGVEVKPVE